MLEFGRTQGGPALRALTFAQRGELLKSWRKALHAPRDELIALALANGGNTRGDAKFDIDGALGHARRTTPSSGTQLGKRALLVDGEPRAARRARRASYGQHVSVPRDGVAVHINAFNFPAWGIAEKAACALLAGMPVITKPATATALVASRMVELSSRRRLLPDGALSFIVRLRPATCSIASDGQDVLAFTGSCDTAAKLRAQPNVAAHVGARERRGRQLERRRARARRARAARRYLRPLRRATWSRDMTQKTGQKCTAIRRVLVPADHARRPCARRSSSASSQVVSAIRALEGDAWGRSRPRTQLREDVRAGIARLARGGRQPSSAATAAWTGARRPEGQGLLRRAGAAPARATAAGDKRVHERRGVRPGGDADPLRRRAAGAAALVRARRRRRWSPRSTPTTARSSRELALGASRRYHGPHLPRQRRSSPASRSAPARCCRSCVHGGPGRAGGGEELGGLRGLAFYLQRVALQGDRALLDSIAPGAGGAEGLTDRGRAARYLTDRGGLQRA